VEWVGYESRASFAYTGFPIGMMGRTYVFTVGAKYQVFRSDTSNVMKVISIYALHY